LPEKAASVTRVISCDAFQEGNDFLLSISTADTAGHRAVVQNLSDLAAMGAAPVGFVWSLEIPQSWLKKQGRLLKDFCNGAAKACEESKLYFYGGDLSFSADRFACTITIFGDVLGTPLSRQGAKPGDLVYVSRPLGLSSFGLDTLFKTKGLRTGKISGGQEASVAAHLWPQAEVELGKKLVGSATACMDISDGLARDLHRLCRASRVGAELNNLEAAFHAALPPKKARYYAVQGGEEYALLFTAPPEFKAPETCIRIGRITRNPVVLERTGNIRKPLLADGYDHFASRT
jgi:thiamine-monophosphate kinase